MLTTTFVWLANNPLTVTDWPLAPKTNWSDVKSAIQFHIDTFGSDQIEIDPPILEAFIAETGIAV